MTINTVPGTAFCCHTDPPSTDCSETRQASSDVLLVTEKLAQQQRKVQAQIDLDHPLEQVWQVLTDYEALDQFIPNLAKSDRIQHPGSGIRIEQVGVQNALLLQFSARVVLDMIEEFPHRIRFDMVEGDFRDFSGSWGLQPASDLNHGKTTLTYNVVVCLSHLMPVALIEQRFCQDLALNLRAIRQRLEDLYRS